MKNRLPVRRCALSSVTMLSATLAASFTVMLGGCAQSDPAETTTKPAGVGTVTITRYDGISDDLLSAGLGKSGLALATAPATSTTPTAAELRRLAIYNNYRALVDTTVAGGYGSFYGPNVDAAGVAGNGEGLVAGVEYRAYSDDGTGERNVTLLVQVPKSFNAAAPCIITATSSGSRGVYGGISTGEWGLKRGCAVAYTDKGTGAAPHDLHNDTVALVDGTRSAALTAGLGAQFNAGLTSTELAAFNTATPNRFAFKHAHSRRNPEKDWGQFTLSAVDFAFWVLNEEYSPLNNSGKREKRIFPSSTVVIASSVSNGGGAALAAAEQDVNGLIDGVAVAEPAVELPASPGVSVRRGATTVTSFGKTLFDFTSHANLYQSCASLAPGLAASPGLGFVVTSFATNRCQSLKAKGLLVGDTTAALAEAALQKLLAYGWEPEANLLHASHAAFEVASAVSVTFANALSRASAKDHLCGYSFGSTSPAGVPNVLAAGLATMAATGNGVPPSAGVQLINNLSVGGPLRDLFSLSPSNTVQDFNLDGALCLRALLTGTTAQATAVQTGINETRRSANLRGKPAIIVHGRSDALLPVNHTSRPYLAMNKVVEGTASKLSYIEVTNAQHFDGFIGLPAVLPGYDTRFVPLHLYLNRALDAMWAHLTKGAALPASQVLRTTARGGTPGAAPALAAAHVPAWLTTPVAADAITMSGATLVVPD